VVSVSQLAQWTSAATFQMQLGCLRFCSVSSTTTVSLSTSTVQPPRIWFCVLCCVLLATPFASTPHFSPHQPARPLSTAHQMHGLLLASALSWMKAQAECCSACDLSRVLHQSSFWSDRVMPKGVVCDLVLGLALLAVR